MELQTSKVDLLLDVDQKPELVPGLFLSLQHVFAMFGATVLVPLILGMPVSVALFASGLGTLIYMVATQFKCLFTWDPLLLLLRRCNSRWHKWKENQTLRKQGLC